MPIPHGAVAAMMLYQLRRNCPNCGVETVVKLHQKNETVQCAQCGAAVPPKQTS